MGALLAGAAAGAVGTTVLDTVTYLDMALRGRAPSGLPSQAADRVVTLVGVELGDGEVADNRRSAIGALLGYATGVGIGVAWGLVRPRARSVPLPVAGVVVGLAAMAGSDVPLTALGLTDPRTWGAVGWLSDLVPHLAYGFATVAAYDALVTG